MQIDFVKNGEEFEIPTISVESDMQMTIDLLKLQIKTGKEVAKDLGVDYKEMQKEKIRSMTEPNYIQSDDAKNYNSILAIQLNLDTVYYVLSRIDHTVSREKVSRLGGTKIAELIMQIFPVEKTGDFPKAAEMKTTAIN